MTPPDQPEKKEKCSCDYPCSTGEGDQERCSGCGLLVNPADAPKTMGEGPCIVTQEDRYTRLRIAGQEISCVDNFNGKPHNLDHQRAKEINAAILSWLKEKGWAGPEEREREKARVSGYMEAARRDYFELKQSLSSLSQERDEMREKAEALRDALEEFGTHGETCIRNYWKQGRPTEGGGYEALYGSVWYEQRPTNRTPKCNCGFEDAIGRYAGKAKGGANGPQNI